MQEFSVLYAGNGESALIDIRFFYNLVPLIISDTIESLLKPAE
jgi:hypothetical protein